METVYNLIMFDTLRIFADTYVHTYQFMAAINFAAVIVAVTRICLRNGVDWLRLLTCMLISCIPLYLGAKAFGMISYVLYCRQANLLIPDNLFTASGIVFYGGMLAYLLSCRLLTKRVLKDQSARCMDIVAATIPLFHGFARIGCFFAGCCYGSDCGAAWCVRLFDGRLPVQLIESAYNFILFAVLMILLYRSKRTRGRITPLYLTCYAVFRFVIEFFRGDLVRGGIGVLSFSQIISILILIGTAIWWYCLRHRYVDTQKELKQ